MSPKIISMSSGITPALAASACITASLLLGACTTAKGTVEVKNQVSWNAPTAEERENIMAVLSAYTTSVTAGDQKLFESQLLDPAIPFSWVGKAIQDSDSNTLKSVQNYAGFRKSIFESGKKLKQRFSNVKIEQVGPLAQVSLDYETAYQTEAYDGKGWKVLQLVKTKSGWKIASEFFSEYPEPAAK